MERELEHRPPMDEADTRKGYLHSSHIEDLQANPDSVKAALDCKALEAQKRYKEAELLLQISLTTALHLQNRFFCLRQGSYTLPLPRGRTSFEYVQKMLTCLNTMPWPCGQG